MEQQSFFDRAASPWYQTIFAWFSSPNLDSWQRSGQGMFEISQMYKEVEESNPVSATGA